MVNGELVDMTAEEIADIENIRAEDKIQEMLNKLTMTLNKT